MFDRLLPRVRPIAEKAPKKQKLEEGQVRLQCFHALDKHMKEWLLVTNSRNSGNWMCFFVYSISMASMCRRCPYRGNSLIRQSLIAPHEVDTANPSLCFLRKSVQWLRTWQVILMDGIRCNSRIPGGDAIGSLCANPCKLSWHTSLTKDLCPKST